MSSGGGTPGINAAWDAIGVIFIDDVTASSAEVDVGPTFCAGAVCIALIGVGLACTGPGDFAGEPACVGASAATFGVADGVNVGSGVFAARAFVGGSGVEVG